MPAWPTAEEANDPVARRALESLSAEFPEGEEQYRAWFVKSMGIMGDPVAGRRRIAEARITGEKLADGGYGYKRAFTVTPDRQTVARIHRLASLRTEIDGVPTVLDPFAGGGSIPFEAARYGCEAVAGELNPVAAAILHGTVRLPAELGEDFSKKIGVWGDLWASRVGKRLKPFFPKQDQEASIAGYIWAHTVPCPTTGRPTPLAPDFWLARDDKRKVAVRLDVNRANGQVTPVVVQGDDAKTYGARSTYKRGTGISIWTHESFDGAYIRAQAKAGNLDEMMLAVSVTRLVARGRQFREPSQADLDAVEAASKELAVRLPGWEVADLVPNDPILPGAKTREPRNMGLDMWRKMFTDRQLLSACTALEELHRIVAEARAELSETEVRALSLYLAFALDKAVDYNSRLSSWHASRGVVRNTFDRHDFAFKWSFAEFDGAAALLQWTLSQVQDSYRGIARLARSAGGDSPPSPVVLRSKAQSLPLPDSSIDAVITDPPYYDNVMYGECSDFFLVWLRRALRETWPELCDLPVSDKQAEAVANASLYSELATHSGRGKRVPGSKTASELADEQYERLLIECFREAHRVLKGDGTMTVMFTHKRVDAWDTLGSALLESGFAILSSWPVHTESEHSLHQAKKNAAQSTILLTCRKRESTAPAYWADIKDEVAAVARTNADRFSKMGIRGVDLSIATYGPSLSVLSRNWPVYTGELDVQGETEVLRPDVALNLARAEVAKLKKADLLGGRDVQFDRLTDFWLLAWSDFEAAEFPSGEALKLCIATNLELEEVSKQAGLVQAKSGTVMLLSPAQRRSMRTLDPDDNEWPSAIDQLHALMLVFDEEGVAASQAWLRRTGLGEDDRLRSLLQAALSAVPRTQVKGEF
ncbi:MAG: DNA methyltransferase, partial [Actinomycetota bacterium]